MKLQKNRREKEYKITKKTGKKKQLTESYELESSLSVFSKTVPNLGCHPRNSLSVKFRERSELKAFETYANRG